MKTKYLFVILGNLFIGSVLAQTNSNIKPAVLQERVISTNYNKEKGLLNSMFKECVGAGRANEGLRADWQQQLAYVKKACDFKYIRMHGLLTDCLLYTSDAADG